jgi:crotonobetainyl-CoA:carnitine CoA-transferase CaiB-like acyl-CoA transferase
MWLSCNRDKRSLALALKTERGQQIVAEIIGRCDIVLENFSPRVFEEFGFDHTAVRRINPRSVFTRMPAFGLDGPWRDALGVGQTMEQISGMAWRTGHTSDQPRIPRGPCDPLAGWSAAFATLACVWSREAMTGDGASVEAAMVESALNAAAELVIEHSRSGVMLQRMGNRSVDCAPQGLYRCAGEDSWLALSVASDAQWAALVSALGSPDWATDPALKTVEARHDAHDRIDQHLAEWTAGRRAEDCLTWFVGNDVPAGVVRDPRDMTEHPQLLGFGYYEASDHPVVGRQLLPSLPFRFGDVSRWSRTRSPLMGEHNSEVLRQLAGLTDPEIAVLAKDGIIGTRPDGR